MKLEIILYLKSTTMTIGGPHHTTNDDFLKFKVIKIGLQKQSSKNGSRKNQRVIVQVFIWCFSVATLNSVS